MTCPSRLAYALYLRGLSTADFQAALPVLLGEDATGPALCVSEAVFGYDLNPSERACVLFHVNEELGIVECIPRPSKYTLDPVVWAVHHEKIRNYVVPRDCPA
jgi:hypothetical protein